MLVSNIDIYSKNLHTKIKIKLFYLETNYFVSALKMEVKKMNFVQSKIVLKNR